MRSEQWDVVLLAPVRPLRSLIPVLVTGIQCTPLGAGDVGEHTPRLRPLDSIGKDSAPATQCYRYDPLLAAALPVFC